MSLVLLIEGCFRHPGVELDPMCERLQPPVLVDLSTDALTEIGPFVVATGAAYADHCGARYFAFRPLPEGPVTPSPRKCPGETAMTIVLLDRIPTNPDGSQPVVYETRVELARDRDRIAGREAPRTVPPDRVCP